MKKARKDFTDQQKSEIYKRDRATCCFSGANLWLLDTPLHYATEADWADHIKPASRGGEAHAEKNGVCAYQTYNMKKRNNSADTIYLFRDGHPTKLYYALFGSPPEEVTERLRRLANLEPANWYFNRSLNSVLIALNGRWNRSKYKRTPEYWEKAAYKKMQIYRDKNVPSLKSRKIISRPNKIQNLMLQLAECESLLAFKKVVSQIYTHYRKNCDAWNEYFESENDEDRKKSFQKIKRNRQQIESNIFSIIRSDYDIRYKPC